MLATLPCALASQEVVRSSEGNARPTARPPQLVRRDSATAFAYTRPGTLRAVTGVPRTLGASARDALRARNLPMAALVAAGTLGLIAADEVVFAESRRAGRRIGLPPNHPSANLRLGPFKQPFPTTLGSGLYFLGDGMATVFVAAGFAARGSMADDTRARRTASELIEGLLAGGTVTQVLKHATGRQTPSEATVPRGRWRPFPPLGDYNRNVPAYDAFPSGHLASAMATVTVIALNYPEHPFVRPVGYTAMTALSFAMVNNGVHWASDYPLALAIGGIVGKVVVDRGRTVVRLPGPSPAVPRTQESERPRGIELAPTISPGFIGARLTW